METAYQDASAAGAATLRNWTGPKASPTRLRRVVKGDGPGWYAWHRTGLEMREKPDDMGFRCVLSIKPVAAK
jgi:hypothetical protein